MQRYSNLRKLPDFRAYRPVKRPIRRVPRFARRLGGDAVRELIASYQAGTSTTELARVYDIHSQTVCKHLREGGVQLRRQSLTTEQVQTAIELYSQGLSLAKIGKRLGCAHTTVRNALHNAKVPIRDTHGQERQVSSQRFGSHSSLEGSV